MNGQPTRRSSLFLMELIVAILFFILAASVCVHLFVKSHTLESESIDLNHAVSAAASVAEILRNEEDPDAFLAQFYSDGVAAENSFSIYYDKNWTPCSSAEAIYTLKLETETANSFLTGKITVLEDADSLYQLTVKKYLEKEVF